MGDGPEESGLRTRHTIVRWSRRRAGRGRVGGRPNAVNADLLRQARDLLPNPDNSVGSIAELLGVSVGALYNHILDLKPLRVTRIPTVSPGER